jgi:hypothetical protein
MPSLLLVVFTLQFLLHIVNTVGAAAVNELVSPAFLHGAHELHTNITTTVMDSLQQAPYADLGRGAKGPEAQEGDRTVEA